MQFDPNALKSLVNDPDNEKFTFFEKKNEWSELAQFDQLNEQSAEKICPSESEYIRPQIYNAEGAKKAKTIYLWFKRVPNTQPKNALGFFLFKEVVKLTACIFFTRVNPFNHFFDL